MTDDEQCVLDKAQCVNDYTSDARVVMVMGSCYTRRTMRIPLSPHDTLISAALRFILEIAALFAIGAGFGIANFLISVLAIAVFNAKGDKRFQGIQVSGPIRLTIELVIAMMGIYGTLLSFGVMWAAIFGAAWVVYLILGRERLVWLARGAR